MTRPMGRWLRSRLWVASVGLLLFISSCAPEGSIQHELNHLDGVLVADDGLYVVPDHAWRREGTLSGFHKTADLLVLVQRERPDALRVTFTPDRLTRRLHFMARWDGEPLWENPRRGADRPLVAEVGGERLTGGFHRLRLERLKELDPAADRDVGRNVFEGVELVRIDGAVEEAIELRVDGYLGRFLDFGVTSRDPTRLSGSLFLGPQSHRFVIEGDGGRASFIVDNQSNSAARFIATIDSATVLEIEVAARDRRDVRFDVPPGKHQVVLATEGARNGRFLWGAPHYQPTTSKRRTPVILITLDTTRRDAVAPYAAKPGRTPFISALARRSSVYLNAYSTAPWTQPSHASVFTGRYPSNHRAGVTDDVLDDSWLTLAERFREGGYRTAAFIGGHMTSSVFGVAQGFSVFRDPRGAEEPGGVLTDAALRVIDRDADLPLFLFLNYFDPHAPYAAPVDFQRAAGVERLAREIADVPVWGSYSRDETGVWGTISNGGAPFHEVALEYLRARYDAEVAYMDSEIGRLLAALDERGLFDDALIVLAADHGEYMGERGLFSHSYRLDPELTAIPLIIKWPGQRQGELVQELVSLVDLYPTIAAVAGFEVPASDGVEFGLASVAGLKARTTVLMEEHKSRFHQLPGPFWIADHLFGLQSLDRREVFFPGFIECQRRLDGGWTRAVCSATWRERADQLPPAMRETLDTEVADSAVDLDDAEAERLRALGYLH